MELSFEPTLLADVIESMFSQGDAMVFDAANDYFYEDKFVVEF